MAMNSFSYTDNARAAFAACLPCFTPSRSEPTSNPPSNAANTRLSDPLCPTARPPSSSSNDLEHLLRDTDSDGISLHSNVGAAASTAHRSRAKRHRRPKFSLTLFGYTLFGRPPIYLSDEEEADPHSGDRRAARALVTTSSSTLDSDAAPLDASTIDRLTSPDHYAALAAQREREWQQLDAEEEARRRAERRARRQERKERARAAALMSLAGASSIPDVDTFEGFQESGRGMVPTQAAVAVAGPDRLGRIINEDGSNASHSGDADDADLGGELYARKKMPSGALSGSGSDSRSRTSASLSVGDASHIRSPLRHIGQQSIPYPHTEMHFPGSMRKKAHRTPKRTSTISSTTSQSTSTVPYTPVEIIGDTPVVAAFPIPQERYIRDGEHTDFPSVGLSGKRPPKSLDPRAFLALQR